MKKILIIEDDALLGDTLKKKLMDKGLKVVFSPDGAEGFEKIKSFQPDLILLDILLPKMNGYEILEAKKKDPSIAQIPVIVISNSGQSVEIDRVMALGVKDYLVKSQFDPEEMLVKVQEQLKKSEGPVSVAASLESEMNQKPHMVNLEGKKIVWVEDDQFLSDIITRKFSPTKCVLFTASDGVEALKIIDKEIPDIVMLDIILPSMDGFEILSKIKSNPTTKNIPVILLSNLGSADDIKKGKNLGAVRFMVKATVTPDEIIDQIKEILSQIKK